MPGDDCNSTNSCAKGNDQNTFLPGQPLSDVEFFIGGPQTFKAMLSALLTAKDNHHFVYLMGWYCDLNFPLDTADPNSTLGNVLKGLDQYGVQIRMLLWAQVLGNYDRFNGAFAACAGWLGNLLGGMVAGPVGSAAGAGLAEYYAGKALAHPLITMNRKTLDFVNALPGNIPFPSYQTPLRGAGGIHDALHGQFRAHHQKVLVVGGNEGLIGFCGGCDINPDRSFPVGTAGVNVFAPGAPLHDVHSQVRGAAALDLYNIFKERWENHPEHSAIDTSCRANTGILGVLPPPPDISPHNGQEVEVVGTYGTGGKPLPSPRNQIGQLLEKAIAAATNFIYIEDQYLYHPKVADLLAAKLSSSLKFLIIVICADVLAQVPQISYRRRQFIQKLAFADAQSAKYKIFQRKFGSSTNPTAGSYVHSKTWIFDDNYAVTGSANIDRRGWYSSSETDIAVRDGTGANPATSTKAHDLRVNLWKQHLGISPAMVADPKEWDPLPASASVEPYASAAIGDPETLFINSNKSDYDDMWDIGIDPFI